MYIEYDKHRIFYEVLGSGSKKVVLLHGWGGPQIWYQYIDRLLESDIQLFVVHLPGFGQSEEPQKIIDSYWCAEMLKVLIDEMDLTGSVIIGHSWGGKIASICQAKYEIAGSLILVDSAGFRRFYLSVWVKNSIVKLSKSILRLFGMDINTFRENKYFQGFFASEDYREATQTMREVLKRVVNEDIREVYSRIKAPTLIIWGDRDSMTPLMDAVEMQREIRKSGNQNVGLKIIQGGSHFPFIEFPDVFFRLITNFIADTYKN